MDSEKFSFRNEVFKNFNSCIETSTSHGFPNIVRNRNWFIKTLWIVCLIASSVYCAYCLRNSFIEYLSYDVNTKISNVRLTSIQFPTITFCNKNPFNVRKPNRNLTLLRTYLSRMKNNIFQIMLPTYNKTFDLIENLNYQISLTVLEYIQNLSDFSFDIDEMMINCKFNDIPCDKNDFEYFVLPKFGNCYKFNSGKNLQGKTADLLRTTNPGSENGFKLELFTGYLDKDMDLITSTGIHLFVHNSSTIPYSDLESIGLPTGFQTDIVINQEHSYKLSIPYSNCIQDQYSVDSFDSILYRKSIELFGKYQQKVCLILCYHEYIKDECGCYHPDAYGINYSKACPYSMRFCIQNKYVDFYKSDLPVKCFDSCPQECNTVKYNYKISQANFPSPFYGQILIEHDKIFPNYARNFTNFDQVKSSVLALNVYHDDVSLALIVEQPSKTIDQLVADIGGFLGLCIGISILSLVEIFELGAKIIILLIKKFSIIQIKPI